MIVQHKTKMFVAHSGSQAPAWGSGVLFVVIAFALLLGGCHRNCLRPNCTYPRALPQANGAMPVPFPPGAQQFPPTGTAPSFPQQAPPIQGNVNPPAPSTPYLGKYPPAAAPGWQPAQARVQLGSPVPTETDPLLDSRQPPPAQPMPNSPIPSPASEPKESQPAPQQPKEKAPASPLPVGIPHFAIAKKGVAAGLRPMLDGGLDWLQDNRYKTVLHIVSPGEDDSADRKQVEKRGMTYLRLEISPQTLTLRKVEEFNRIVSNRDNYPLFVYDKDGSLAGGLWYLHFRFTEYLGDLDSRAQAAALGLQPNGEGPHREMWLAIQNFLSRQGK